MKLTNYRQENILYIIQERNTDGTLFKTHKHYSLNICRQFDFTELT